MYNFFAILLALSVLLSNSVEAGEANACWIAPTTNTDGSALTDLASYELHYGCNASGVYPVFDTLPATALCHVVLALPDVGTCYFAITAINSVDVASAFSNEASKLMGLLSVPPDSDSIQVTWQESQSIYSLPETDFTGTPIVAGTFSTPGQSLTIDFEITPRSLDGDARIISKATGTATQAHYFMVSESNNRLRFRLRTNGNTSTLLGNAIIPLNVKTVGSAVYDGQNMSLFFNGQLDAQLAKSGDMDVSNAVEVWVGGNPPNNSGSFDGLIKVTVR